MRQCWERNIEGSGVRVYEYGVQRYCCRSGVPGPNAAVRSPTDFQTSWPMRDNKMKSPITTRSLLTFYIQLLLLAIKHQLPREAPSVCCSTRSMQCAGSFLNNAASAGRWTASGKVFHTRFAFLNWQNFMLLQVSAPRARPYLAFAFLINGSSDAFFLHIRRMICTSSKDAFSGRCSLPARSR
jgi:hypothetical protein